MKKILFPAFCSLGLSLFSFAAHAQAGFQKNSIGFTPGAQRVGGIGVRPAFSINYERRISRLSGIETGIGYLDRMAQRTTDPTNYKSNGTYYRLLTLPILYRLHTNAINIAAGPSFNMRLGSPEKNTPTVLGLKAPDKFSLGYLFKISKPLRLNDRLVLDPEAGIYGNTHMKTLQWSTGIGLKYRF